ncbi:uncharacterized protein METZ01_LOCUS476342 [marine metagenome]|uniref:Uncharacterized protein n=1 Tax=marine metagenome TaxID=408172 RepID=A0A383BVT0_9ZZZZ
MVKTLKKEYEKGGSQRQHILDKAVKYILDTRFGTQNHKHIFLIEEVGLTETEYLECLNKAINGGVIWNTN